MKSNTFSHRPNASCQIDLSIIIVNYNTRVLLHQCIQSVRDAADRISIEIIVVDNNSGDGSAAMIQSCFPDVQLIGNDKNLGFSAACNQGLKTMRGIYACLLNPDTIVCNGALEHMVKLMQTHSRIGALGCKLLNDDGTEQCSCFRFYSLKRVMYDYCLLPKQINKSILIGDYDSKDLGTPTSVDWVLGACLFLRSKAIAEVGFLDEDLFMYSEEVDWCYRAKKKGWEIWFTPDAEIIHYGGQAAKQESHPALVELYRSRYQFFRKHHGLFLAYYLRILVAFLTIWNSIFLLLRFLLRRMEGRELTKQVGTYWKVAKLQRPEIN